MCGIAGIVGKSKSYRIDEPKLSAITDMMKHRGPDDRGILVNGHWGFGHRRLSILDLDHGHQPFEVSQYGLTVVYNGEIYNFNEIRDELLEHGYSFNTHCDTEVLVKAFDRWGIDAVNRFNGMFAFAIRNNRTDEVWLVRDRLGIKPLYYTQTSDAWAFASEPKVLLAFRGGSPEINPDAIHSYLSYRYPLGEMSFYKEIKQLQPGYYARIKGAQISIRQYWELPAESEAFDVSEDAWLAKLEDIITSSVKYRMVSDVPVGSYLSGGVDSSLIATLMSKMRSAELKTFTIGFEEEAHNEFRYAREVADVIGADHKEITMDIDQYMDINKQLIIYKDAPLAVPNEVPLHLMSKILKEDITVVLSGEGADELFGGYGRIFHTPFDYHRILASQGVRESIDFLGGVPGYLPPEHSSFHSNNGLVDLFLDRYAYINRATRGRYLHPEFVCNNDPENILREAFEKTSDLEMSNRILWTFEKHHLPGLLGRLDNATMATSVEGRVPFVDHRLAELAFQVPVSMKNKWRNSDSREKALDLPISEFSETMDETKYLLRKMSSQYLPKSVIDRKKMGFPVPLALWFKGKGKMFIKDVLSDDVVNRAGIINTEYVKNKLNDDVFMDNPGNGMHMWMLMNIAIWHESIVKRGNI